MTTITELNDSQREIISLLSSEIRLLSEQECPRLKQASGESLNELLYEQSVQIEHIANALEIAGLTAVASCAKIISNNMQYLYERPDKISSQHISLMLRWGPLFVLYLETLEQNTHDQSITPSILQLVRDTHWPKPLNDASQSEIIEQFEITGANTLVDEQDTLPENVTPEMSSLTVDKSIRPELLQGLLIELPNQISEFEASLTQYAKSGEVEQLNQAQRVAHTIKGSANIVSVTGLANLMHFTEDLLEKIQKENEYIPKNFYNFLERISDCLAACADFLNSLGPYPEELENTLTELLYWLKNGKPLTASTAPLIPHSRGNIAPTEGGKNALKTEPIAQPKEAEDNHFIQVAERTAQELLRLSGETQISHNQVSAQIGSIQDAVKICEGHQEKIKSLAADFEYLVQAQSTQRAASVHSDKDELDPLEMEQFNELHSFSHQLIELTTDAHESIHDIHSQLTALDTLLLSQKQLNRDHQHILLGINLVPVNTYLSRFSRCVRQACRLTNKVATLEIVGGDISIDSHVLKNIIDPIMHLLRNAVDHGLENNGEERKRQGKPIEGKISLSFFQQGEIIKIDCQDDGRGLDYDRIFEKALHQELINANHKKSPQELNQIVLLPGFSTREQATQTSGRGVGLDAVSTSIRALKGHLQIDSSKNEGCKFTITVPSSILTAHAIVTKIQSHDQAATYSLLSRSIEQIIYVRPDQINKNNTGNFYLFDDVQTPVYPITDLLGLTNWDWQHTNALLLCKQDNEKKLFIAVDQILASQELVVKSFNESTFVPEGVLGATIMGDGTVSPVIDLSALPDINLDYQTLVSQSRRREQFSSLRQHHYKNPPAALVVDDSLSARRSLAQFITDMGMDVVTAKDGFDAIEQLEKRTPSLLIVDLEMPRMNGLELTSHLRSREEYKDIPVIMITSRSTDRHKNLAKNAGVNTYLTKPWSEDELMQCIEKQIA